MEVVTFVKDMVQNLAEHAASYKIGQSALRYLDRALWVVEKSARWAVPPPLDQDERPQPELVRPLPWIFFLMLLFTLRVTRESISLIYLVLGKPPLRSADVVMYIQSKRRYLRTLKYQGSRLIRARSASNQPWYSGLRSLFEFTMCFRRSNNYGNNNTTRVSNNDEVFIVKRSKRDRDSSSPAPNTSENTMERLIEKMMVDLDCDSEDDSSFTLTNAQSSRSEDSDTEATEQHNSTLTSVLSNDTLENSNPENNTDVAKTESARATPVQAPDSEPKKGAAKSDDSGLTKNKDKTELSEPTNVEENSFQDASETPIHEDAAFSQNNPESASTLEESQKFIEGERCATRKPASRNTIGRKISSAFSKTFSKSQKIEAMGLQTQKRDGNTPADIAL